MSEPCARCVNDDHGACRHPVCCCTLYEQVERRAAAEELLDELVGVDRAAEAALGDADEWWISDALVARVRAFLAGGVSDA